MRIWFSGLRGKLALMILIPMIVLLAITATGIYAFEAQNRDLTFLGKERAPKLVTVGLLRMNNHAIMKFMLLANSSKLDDPKRQSYVATAEERIQQFSDDLAKMEKFQHTELFKTAFAPVYEKWKLYETAAHQTLTLLKQNSEAGNQLARTEIEKSVGPVSNELVVILTESQKIVTDNMNGVIETAGKDASFLFYLIILVSGIGTAFSLAYGIFTAKHLAGRLGRITQTLAEAGRQLTTTSTDIASTSLQLSEASTEQASSLQETAASLEEISSMIARSAVSASSTETSSAESQQKAEEGRKAVDQMLLSMDEISQSNKAIMNQVSQSNQEMTEIVRVIQEIGNKTKVINEIVFQTKLLSFNASVEAARAGEHGKGFAVVAEEVGNLAQMSGNAAKEITEMLEASISKVEVIVRDTKSKVETLVDQGKNKVEMGVSLARQCSGVLIEIVEGVSRVTGLAQEISSASKEQSQGVNEINKAMGQLDSTTHQNSATSEQAARAAQELSLQADSLKASVDELVMTVDGKMAHGHQAAEPARRSAARESAKAPSNLIHLKAQAKKPEAKARAKTFKSAVGDGSIPSRDDDGFHDV